MTYDCTVYLTIYSFGQPQISYKTTSYNTDRTRFMWFIRDSTLETFLRPINDFRRTHQEAEYTLKDLKALIEAGFRAGCGVYQIGYNAREETFWINNGGDPVKTDWWERDHWKAVNGGLTRVQ